MSEELNRRRFSGLVDEVLILCKQRDELLEACKGLLAVIEGDAYLGASPQLEECRLAALAIAKAEGENA